MRHRRAERCLLRASAALDAQVPEAASEVLAEARALCPEHPDIEAVSARLSESSDPPPPTRRSVPRWITAAVIGGALGMGVGSASVWTTEDSAAVTRLVRVVTTTAAHVAAAATNLVAPGGPSAW